MRYLMKWEIERIIKCYETAANSKKSFHLSLQDLYDCYTDQNGCCALTGIQFDEFHHIMSLDRRDSGDGYNNGNIQFVLRRINFMKSNLSEIIFVDLCKKVANFKNGRPRSSKIYRRRL